MIRMRKVQQRIAQQYHHLFMFSLKQPGKRLVAGLCNDTFPYPRPGLCLRRPELFAVAAEPLVPFFFLLFFFLSWISSQITH